MSAGPMFSFRVADARIAQLLNALPDRSDFIRQAVIEKLRDGPDGDDQNPAPEVMAHDPDTSEADHVQRLRDGLIAIANGSAARRMASYHLSVKTIKRSAGRSATAAAAYRAGACIACQREGRIHDSTARRGIGETFILTPGNAPDWASDRSRLWNAAEASETRPNSVTAREWELALPSEISAGEHSRITRDFALQLVSRYGVAVDVAIHAPHREGDQRNHHAHILTSTRKLEAEGFTAKTRVLDSARTGGVEIEQMRGLLVELQNAALGRDRAEPSDAETGEQRSIRERLDDVLNKPRARLEIEDEREQEREVETERETGREADRDPGLSL